MLGETVICPLTLENHEDGRVAETRSDLTLSILRRAFPYYLHAWVTLGDFELGPKTAGICLHRGPSLLQVSAEAEEREHTLCEHPAVQLEH